jgi:hypothetical protein
MTGTGTPPFAGTGTGPLGTNLCDYDAPITNPTGYHYLCLSPNAQGGGLIAYGAAGGATQLPLTAIINGVSYPFPFVLTGVLGPGSSTVGNLALWNNTNGTLLKDGGLPVSGQVPPRLATWFCGTAPTARCCRMAVCPCRPARRRWGLRPPGQHEQRPCQPSVRDAEIRRDLRLPTTLAASMHDNTRRSRRQIASLHITGNDPA